MSLSLVSYIKYLSSYSLKFKKLKKIFKVARDLLCIPATSAASERVFKAADDHITHDRCRLKPENASKLIFMQQALKTLETSLYQLCYETVYDENTLVEEDIAEEEIIEDGEDVDSSIDGSEEDALLFQTQHLEYDDDHDVSDIL